MNSLTNIFLTIEWNYDYHNIRHKNVWDNDKWRSIEIYAWHAREEILSITRTLHQHLALALEETVVDSGK